jgi:selenide,water dikinase
MADARTANASGDVRADVVVDQEYADDAAIVRAGPDGRGIVLTADIIAPLVDDPEAFGEIAATNAISDVYAMGGEPRWALNLVFFPDDVLPLDVLHAILRGGARACARAGVAIVGGHSVRDSDVKYGLSVTGEVALDAVLSNRGARAGDALILTKALGTGVIGNAIKAGLASDAEAAAAIASMTRSNGDALAIARRHGVTACTDVTGFGLCGHLRNLVRGSSLDATIALDALPVLPGARAHAAAGLVPGGSRANRAFLVPMLRWASGAIMYADLRVDEPRELALALACDAQTSGGLLLCIPAARAAACVDALRAADHAASLIGELQACAGTPTITLA